MKTCDYCGKQNEDVALLCGECGTTLFLTEKAKVKSEPSTGLLNARSANRVLLAFAIVEIFLGGGFAYLSRIAVHSNDLKYTLSLLAQWVLVPVLEIVVIALTANKLIPKHLQNTNPDGAAWVRGAWRSITKGMAVGLVIGLSFCALDVFMKSHCAWFSSVPRHSGMNGMVSIAGLPRIIYVTSALLLAPLLEELLFRGVLYGGYRKSLGPVWAAFLTTLLFVAIHCTTSVFNIVGLTSLALAALWFRLRAKAIGPSIAVHIGYNSAVALAYLFPIFSWLVK